ncbi:MAG TPA: response regulator transcription factor [Bacteroidales bacterium]|nr:response regulator transcription factor [Bacteroidales bacterium]
MKKLKVFIVDDHDMFREGVKVLLNKSKVIEIVGEAENGQEYLDKVDKYSPDVTLMDINMPVMDGIEATRKRMAIDPDSKILTLSMFGDEEYYFKMIQAGVKGFVLKSSGIAELENAITEVAKGEIYFSAELVKQIITNIKTDKAKIESAKDKDLLSNREVEVLKLIAAGLSNDEIANKLNISVATVKSHRANLLKKTNCNNTASLVIYAIRNKLFVVE